MNRQSLNRKVERAEAQLGSPPNNGRLILPLPPSVNHAYRNFTTPQKRRMRVLTSKAKAFKEEAEWRTKAWMQKTGWIMPNSGKKVIVRIWVFWKSNQRRDTDNIMKLLLDSMKEIAFWDDRMVLPRVMDFAVDKGNPRIEVELEEVGMNETMG